MERFSNFHIDYIKCKGMAEQQEAMWVKDTYSHTNKIQTWHDDTKTDHVLMSQLNFIYYRVSDTVWYLLKCSLQIFNPKKMTLWKYFFSLHLTIDSLKTKPF